MQHFAEFSADIEDDALRGLGGVVEVPAGRAVAWVLAAAIRAAGRTTTDPAVSGSAWSFTTHVRRGSVVCTLQQRDHWYLATDAREGKSARFLGRSALETDHTDVDALLDRTLRANARISEVRWYSPADYEARITTIPAATYDELLAHGLSDTFARFVTEGRRRAQEVSYWCDDPNESWRYYVPPIIERPRQLWSTNADPTIACTMDGRTTFVKIYHDDVGHQVIGHGENALATSLLSQVMDSEDWEDEDLTRQRLRALAAEMGYRHMDALEAYFASSADEDLTDLIRRLEGDGARGG
jgi:hypothetical protein